MQRKYLTKHLNDLYPAAYSLSFILVPDNLQAEQVCIDSLKLLMLKENNLMEQIVAVADKRREPLLEQLKKVYFKHICALGIKRFGQLRGSSSTKRDHHCGAFYDLSVLQRSALFLKGRLRFDLDDIEFIINRDRYDVLSYLAKSRDCLLQVSQGRSVAIPAIIGD